MEYQFVEIAQESKHSLFRAENIRLGCVRKVFAVLMVQQFIAFGIMAIFMLNDEAKAYSGDHHEIAYSSMAICSTVYSLLLWCGAIRRQLLIKLILLGIYDICQGLMHGFIAVRFQGDEALYATAIFATICLALTLFVFQSELNFTWTNRLITLILLNVLIFGVITSTGQWPLLQTTYIWLGFLIFSLYLEMVNEPQLSHLEDNSPVEHTISL